ncbi:MAG: nucleotidyltransferase domain-containing protein, partial [Nanoarchaeota archaeon]
DNIETKFFLLYSEIYKTLTFLEKYPGFKTFIKELNLDSLIIIFGGFAKLITNKTSDIDILVVSDKEEQLPMHLLPNKLHQINISKNAFLKSLNKQETLIKEIEENHIILNNHSSYINITWSYYGGR